VRRIVDYQLRQACQAYISYCTSNVVRALGDWLAQVCNLGNFFLVVKNICLFGQADKIIESAEKHSNTPSLGTQQPAKDVQDICAQVRNYGVYFLSKNLLFCRPTES
jgi:hypothetical protein